MARLVVRKFAKEMLPGEVCEAGVQGQEEEDQCKDAFDVVPWDPLAT